MTAIRTLVHPGSLADAQAPTALEVRLARNADEIEAAQRLRYRVFMQELGARGAGEGRGLDADDYDAVADHLIVLDPALGAAAAAVVGTYRLLRRQQAARCGGFYTAHEFDIAPLLRLDGEILELGRSCIDPAYRNRSTIQLLWRAIAAEVMQSRIAVMFGCASLPGVDPDLHAVALGYLHGHHLAPPALRPRAIAAERVPPPDPAAAPPPRQAAALLPPLLKGYLRLGGWIGEGAVIDRQFNTTDVCMVVMTENLTDRYIRHYAGGAVA